MKLTTSVWVYVSAKHLARGVRGSKNSCPVHLALEECLKLTPRQFVVSDFYVVRGEYGAVESIARLPQWVSDKIYLYDKGVPTEPFGFRFEVPNTWMDGEKRVVT